MLFSILMNDASATVKRAAHRRRPATVRRQGGGTDVPGARLPTTTRPHLAPRRTRSQRDACPTGEFKLLFCQYTYMDSFFLSIGNNRYMASCIEHTVQTCISKKVLEKFIWLPECCLVVLDDRHKSILLYTCDKKCLAREKYIRCGCHRQQWPFLLNGQVDDDDDDGQ